MAEPRPTTGLTFAPRPVLPGLLGAVEKKGEFLGVPIETARGSVSPIFRGPSVSDTYRASSQPSPQIDSRDRDPGMPGRLIYSDTGYKETYPKWRAGHPGRPQRDPNIGELSARGESSGKGAGTISTGIGDKGGKSYGIYQLALKTGTLANFLASKEAQSWSGRFKDTPSGSPAFDQAWRAASLEDPLGFGLAQHRFIERTHYNPAAKTIQNNSGIDLNKRSYTLQRAMWSLSDQMPSLAPSIFEVARKKAEAAGLKATDGQYDAALVKGLYDERFRQLPNGVLRYFPSSPKDKAGLIARGVREEAEAQAMMGGF